MRFGDKAMGIGNKDQRSGLGDEAQVAQLAVQCAQQLAAQAGWAAPCAIIVESDSSKAKKAAAAHSGGLCKVWVSSIAPSHTAQGGGASNWLAWARLTTVELLLFTGSTFSRNAGNVGAPAVEKKRLIDLKKFLPKRSALEAGADIAC